MDFFKNITFFTTGVFATLFWVCVIIFILLVFVGGCVNTFEHALEREQITYVSEYTIVDTNGYDIKYGISENGDLYRNDDKIWYNCSSVIKNIEDSKSIFIEYCNISKTNNINQYNKKINSDSFYSDNGVFYERSNGKDYLVLKYSYESICIPKANINGFISFLKKGEEIENRIKAKEEAKRKEEERINSLYEKNEKKEVSEKKTKSYNENYVYSSDTYEYYTDEETTDVEDLDESKIYDVAEEMPQFPGGSAALFEYLNNNIRYPIVAQENGVQGRVVTTFVVECDGSISDVKVVKSVDPSLDIEAKRIVRSMPSWIPAKQNGKRVRAKYTVPVTFRLYET